MFTHFDLNCIAILSFTHVVGLLMPCSDGKAPLCFSFKIVLQGRFRVFLTQGIDNSLLLNVMFVKFHVLMSTRHNKKFSAKIGWR